MERRAVTALRPCPIGLSCSAWHPPVPNAFRSARSLSSRSVSIPRRSGFCATAKVTNLHLHDLRAEFAAQVHESGVALHVVRDALGHPSVTMTDRYLRSRVDSLSYTYRTLAAAVLARSASIHHAAVIAPWILGRGTGGRSSTRSPGGAAPSREALSPGSTASNC